MLVGLCAALILLYLVQRMPGPLAKMVCCIGCVDTLGIGALGFILISGGRIAVQLVWHVLSCFGESLGFASRHIPATPSGFRWQPAVGVFDYDTPQGVRRSIRVEAPGCDMGRKHSVSCRISELGDGGVHVHLWRTADVPAGARDVPGAPHVPQVATFATGEWEWAYQPSDGAWRLMDWSFKHGVLLIDLGHATARDRMHSFGPSECTEHFVLGENTARAEGPVLGEEENEEENEEVNAASLAPLLLSEEHDDGPLCDTPTSTPLPLKPDEDPVSQLPHLRERKEEDGVNSGPVVVGPCQDGVAVDNVVAFGASEDPSLVSNMESWLELDSRHCEWPR